MAEYLQANVLKSDIIKVHNLDMDVIVHESVDSTNSWSLQQCKAGKILPFACFAENQTVGKGRRGKQWIMSARSNIAMSVSWPYALLRQQLHLLPLSIALAVVETLEKLNLGHVQIKWPNDVYVQGKKIAGILIETQSIKQKMPDDEVLDDSSLYDSFVDKGQAAVVIGVGLNYDMSSFTQLQVLNRPHIFPEVTDIEQEFHKQRVGQKVGRSTVASLLLQHVVSVCQNYQLDSPLYLERFRERYDFCRNKHVEITQENQEVLYGIAQGVNERAELIVMIYGENHVFNSAEISVKANP